MTSDPPYQPDNQLPESLRAIVADQMPIEIHRSRRGRLELIAIGIMALGALMMFQPFTIALYSYSFLVILAGTLMFIIVSHFPE
jgi:hypothetical protein